MSTLNEDNYRYELKFLLTRSKAEILKYRLSLIMEKDLNADTENGEYIIRSLYFDDIYNTSYYEKIDGIKEREKYRIRCYNGSDSFITLELKAKNGDLSYKRRCRIEKSDYVNIITRNYDLIDTKGKPVLEDFLYRAKSINLKPSVIVEYKRIAYTYPFEDVRITFDEDIASGKHNYDLFDEDLILYNVMEEGEVVLEVKYNNKLPSILNDVIKTVPMMRIAVSKFALCTERKGV